MKRLLIPIWILLLICLCNKSFAQEKTKEKDDMGKMKKKGMSMDNTSYPYTANYSSNFAIGKPEQAKMILDLWKDWDDNLLDRHDYMADTLVMFFSDGTMMKGKDSCLAAAKRFRGSLTSATSSLDAWIPLRSLDRNQDWVALWGSETDVFPDGKTTKRDVQEIWRINQDGKVVFMKQYASMSAPQQ